MSNVLDKLDEYDNLYNFVKCEISQYHFDKWKDDNNEHDMKYKTFRIMTNFEDLIENFQGTPGTDPDLTRPTTKKHYDLWNQIGYDSKSTFGRRQDLIKTKTHFGTTLADILGLDYPQIVMTEQRVGQNIPMHMDVNASASDAGFGIEDTIERGIRIILFVTDWEPGQVFMMGNRTLSQWRAGETLYWPVTKYPHGTYNGSHKICYRIRISGLATKKFYQTIKNDITI
tara:strand:+ start:1938 stop:2621 length:684 start_codon:yes stop_codon:yes gene_type:complete